MDQDAGQTVAVKNANAFINVYWL